MTPTIQLFVRDQEKDWDNEPGTMGTANCFTANAPRVGVVKRERCSGPGRATELYQPSGPATIRLFKAANELNQVLNLIVSQLAGISRHLAFAIFGDLDQISI